MRLSLAIPIFMFVSEGRITSSYPHFTVFIFRKLQMKVLSTTLLAVSVGNPKLAYEDREGKNDSDRMLRSMPEAKKPENYRKFGHLFKVIDGHACWMKSRNPDVVYLFAKYKKSAAVIVIDDKSNEATGILTLDVRGEKTGVFNKDIPLYTDTLWMDPSMRGKGVMSEVYEIVLTKNGILQDFSLSEDSFAFYKKLVSKGYPLFFMDEHGDVTVASEDEKAWRNPSIDLLLMPKGTTLQE